jgi:hypothetical protein
VALGDTDIDDFALLPNGVILLSVEKDLNLAGFGLVGDEDVLKFTPTSLALNNTRGTVQPVLWWIAAWAGSGQR